MQIILQNVSKKFQKSFSLKGVNLEFNSGDKVAIMGANGAGKTTLIRAMMGYYHIDGGSISVGGFDPIKERVEVLKNIAFIPQLPPPIKINLKELVNFAAKSAKIDKDIIEFYATKMELELENHWDKSFFKLSGGMKQKLLIAIALARKTPIMIFDEATANLDPKGREIFYSMIGKLPAQTIMLFITHRLDDIKTLINRQIYMDLAKVVSDEKI